MLLLPSCDSNSAHTKVVQICSGTRYGVLHVVYCICPSSTTVSEVLLPRALLES